MTALGGDIALDFVDSLAGKRGAERVRRKLHRVASALPTIQLDADVAEEALAAAEIVASAYGWLPTSVPDHVLSRLPSLRKWLSDEDRRVAMSALARLGKNSELLELWRESDPNAWPTLSEDLSWRLAQPPRDLPPKPKRPKRVKVVAGDIVLLPVALGAFAPAKVLVISQKYPNYIILGLYKATVKDFDPTTALPDVPGVALVTFLDLVRDQVWQRVDSRPPTEHELQALGVSDIPNINTVPICFSGSVENRARALLNLPRKDYGARNDA
jgi:hypothetical protein